MTRNRANHGRRFTAPSFADVASSSELEYGRSGSCRWRQFSCICKWTLEAALPISSLEFADGYFGRLCKTLDKADNQTLERGELD